MTGGNLKKATRLRMAETGEKYTQARRAILADPAEFSRLRDILDYARERHRYPSTDRDGLDRRHLLSAWETSRRAH